MDQMRLQNERLHELVMELYHRKWPLPPQPQRPLLAPPVPAMNSPVVYHDLSALPPALQPVLRESHSESFYLPLHHLAFDDALSQTHSNAITDYLSRRQEVVTNLRKSFDADASPQGPGETYRGDIQGLGTLAETIRQQLTAKNVNARRNGTESFRQILDRPPKTYSAAMLDAVQATEAACYHDGLSTGQREALLELAMQLQAGDDATKSLSRGTGLVFFLPWRARIEIPAALPTALRDDLDAFIAAKQKVKDELLATARAVARMPARAKTTAYRDLAVRQRSHWAELETRAEALRIAFKSAGHLSPPPASPAPEDLTARVARALLKKTALQRELTEFVQSLRQLLPGEKIEIVRHGDALAINRASGSKPSRLSSRDERKIQSAITATNAQFAQFYAPLVRELDDVRLELERFVSGLPDGEKITTDAIANNLLQSWVARQNWTRYAHYRTAVLAPGLSPEARSLLFHAAIVDLQPPPQPASEKGQ